MVNFTVLREEQATISEGSCPVDLMGEIASYGREINTAIPYCYRWTFAALHAMQVFPVEKDVRWIPIDPKQNLILIKVIWVPSSDTMDLYSTDGGKTFMVLRSQTEEIDCELEDGKAYIRYTIDVK